MNYNTENTEQRQEFIVKKINKSRFDSRKNFKRSLLYTASAAFLVSACATQPLFITVLYGVCAVLNAFSAVKNLGKTCKGVVTTHQLKEQVDKEVYRQYKVSPGVMKKANKFLKRKKIR